MTTELKIAIIAGEPSGDLLGADLITTLKSLHPNLTIEGIAGPQMIKAGAKSLFPMEHLSVMGLEVIPRLPKILKIRREIINHFLKTKPDIFIGIDAPDFNLTVEEKLKAAGIKTLHYVSPSVWAWKQWRLKKIARAVDMMLTILPFEKKFYDQKNIPARFVGHPLAETIPLESNKNQAREILNLPQDNTIIAILPGSRSNEIKYLGKLFLQTALSCQKKASNLIFIAPMVNAKIHQEFSEQIKAIAPNLPITLIDNQAQTVMAAADVILLASGTATLQATLVKRPMVVAYRLSKLGYLIGKLMIKTAYISLPNLLANKALVPELIQDDATVENLTIKILNYLNNPKLVADLIQEFTKIHLIMRQNASEQAAQAVLDLTKNK